MSKDKRIKTRGEILRLYGGYDYNKWSYVNTIYGKHMREPVLRPKNFFDSVKREDIFWKVIDSEGYSVVPYKCNKLYLLLQQMKEKIYKDI